MWFIDIQEKIQSLDEENFNKRFTRHTQFSKVSSRNFEDDKIVYSHPDKDSDIDVLANKGKTYQELIGLRDRFYDEE